MGSTESDPAPLCVRPGKKHTPELPSITLYLLHCQSRQLMHCDTLKQDNGSTVRGDGGSRVGEVRAGTTSPIPSHCTAIILFQSVAVHQLS